MTFTKAALWESRNVQGFYNEVLSELLHRDVLQQEMSVLVVCGGLEDKDALLSSGLSHGVISNIGVCNNANDFAPFHFSLQDAEHLSFDDNTFDFCVVHSGLHHCYSPHRALLEMYRVARKGILMFEPYDNLVTRLGVLLTLGQEYEHAAVFYNECSCGGARNSAVPNYIYRWTEREIIKTINSGAPYGNHRFGFFYKMRIPWFRFWGGKNRVLYYLTLCLYPFIKSLTVIMPRQSNNFAAVVLKPQIPHDLHPWLSWKDDAPQLNVSWLAERYNRKTS